MAFNLHRRVSVSTHSTAMTRDFSAQARELSLAIANASFRSSLSAGMRLRGANFTTMNVRFEGKADIDQPLRDVRS